MTTTPRRIETGPEPFDISIYQGADSPIVFWPFGQGLPVPEGFAGYQYVMDVWDGDDFEHLLLTSSGDTPTIETIRDDVMGKITFLIRRDTALGLDWSTVKNYDIREIDASEDAIQTPLFAGALGLELRGKQAT